MLAVNQMVLARTGDEGAVVLGFLVTAGLVILSIVIWWKIFAKAGYGGPLGLLMLVPVVNLIMILVLAFAEWPVQRELNSLRQQMVRPAGPVTS